MQIPAIPSIDESVHDFTRQEGKGHAALAENDVESAILFFSRALTLKPGDGTTMVNLANCLRRVGRYDDAIKLLRTAKISGRLRPFVDANLAIVLHDLGRYQDALDYYARACAVMPENDIIAWNQSQTLLTLGRYREGWPGYTRGINARVRGKSRYPLPLYQADSWPEGRVLLYKEQGIGDQILFASCFNDIPSASDDCVIECSSRLVALFQRSFPNLTFVAEDDVQMDTIDDFNYQMPMGSILSYFRNESDDFPKNSNYIIPDSDLVRTWKREFDTDNRPIIGISWRGGTLKDDIARRQIELGFLLLQLRNLPVKVLILQHNISKDEDQLLSELGAADIAYPLGPETGNDIDQLAAMVSVCDLVISVGNTVLNLAGAMGKKSFGLLPYNTSWRWGVGEVSSWYPSIRLFRQDVPGEWHNVIQRLVTELHSVTKTESTLVVEES